MRIYYILLFEINKRIQKHLISTVLSVLGTLYFI